ncbi:MAG: hypothetical protein AAFU65_08145, partial [Pseudomonadota bacterium]
PTAHPARAMANERPPLSHHDILRLSAPFARRGLRADLAASDRAARRITFVPGEPDRAGEIDLTFDLYLLDPDPPVLIRRASHGGALQATASAQGMDISILLDHLDTLDPANQFRSPGEALVADSYDLTDDGEHRLTACAAVVGGLLVELDARTVVGEPMTARVYSARHGVPVRLPDDLFTLVDRRWRPLFEADEGYSTSLRPPVSEPARSQTARDVFAQTMDHMSRVLSRPPGDYHAQHGRRRWWVFGRRYVPIGLCVAIVGALPLIDRYLIDEDTQLHPGFLSLPPVLMIAVMLLSWRDMPLFGFPPLPRRLADNAWPVSPHPENGDIA